ncbi:hypothetical protein ACOME3_002663 [Neoechinorhynchus agilis]
MDVFLQVLEAINIFPLTYHGILELIADWRTIESMIADGHMRTPSCQIVYRRLGDLACRLDRLNAAIEFPEFSKWVQLEAHIKKLKEIEIDLGDCEKALSRVEYVIKIERNQWSENEMSIIDSIVKAMLESIQFETQRIRETHSELTVVLWYWETFEQAFISVKKTLVQCEADLCALDMHTELNSCGNQSTFDEIIQRKYNDLSYTNSKIAFLNSILNEISPKCKKSRYCILQRRIRGLSESYKTLLSWCDDICGNAHYSDSSSHEALMDDNPDSQECSRRSTDPWWPRHQRN